MSDNEFTFITSKANVFSHPTVMVRSSSACINATAFRLLGKPGYVTIEATNEFQLRVKACDESDVNACRLSPASLGISRLLTFTRKNGLATGIFTAELRDGALYAQLRKAESE